MTRETPEDKARLRVFWMPESVPATPRPSEVLSIKGDRPKAAIRGVRPFRLPDSRPFPRRAYPVRDKD
ncbi:hypothetical protein V6C03_07280 [Methyloligella sp. 2.7D]|uniref:hypothetical protein n=1 Tax=unclassified Methyloligella TaxID=2625955 RepID=UPI00157CD0BF|nr:hypothetical protein [Methyloligella sp. GL2]QKP78307.1 hypothetical protein HT051_13165 [Methyloligella sp. GL2]